MFLIGALYLVTILAILSVWRRKILGTFGFDIGAQEARDATALRMRPPEKHEFRTLEQKG